MESDLNCFFCWHFTYLLSKHVFCALWMLYNSDLGCSSMNSKIIIITWKVQLVLKRKTSETQTTARTHYLNKCKNVTIEDDTKLTVLSFNSLCDHWMVVLSGIFHFKTRSYFLMKWSCKNKAKEDYFMWGVGKARSSGGGLTGRVILWVQKAVDCFYISDCICNTLFMELLKV